MSCVRSGYWVSNAVLALVLVVGFKCIAYLLALVLYWFTGLADDGSWLTNNRCLHSVSGSGVHTVYTYAALLVLHKLGTAYSIMCPSDSPLTNSQLKRMRRLRMLGYVAVGWTFMGDDPYVKYGAIAVMRFHTYWYWSRRGLNKACKRSIVWDFLCDMQQLCTDVMRCHRCALHVLLLVTGFKLLREHMHGLRGSRPCSHSATATHPGVGVAIGQLCLTRFFKFLQFVLALLILITHATTMAENLLHVLLIIGGVEVRVLPQ